MALISDSLHAYVAIKFEFFYLDHFIHPAIYLDTQYNFNYIMSFKAIYIAKDF